MSSWYHLAWYSSEGGAQKRERIAEVDLGQMTLGHVRAKAREVINSDDGNGDLVLLHRGKILSGEDDEKVADKGVVAGSTVHAVKRPRRDPVPKLEPKDLSEEETRRFFIAFGMAIAKPEMAASVRRMTGSRESLETLAVTCPGLAADPVALAVLEARPEMLFMLMSKKETLKKMAKFHPALIEAMDSLAAAVNEEESLRRGGQQQPAMPPGAFAPFEYSMDEMEPMEGDEDDEDDDGMMDAAAAGPNDVQRNRSFSAITPDQLAAAIQAVQGAVGGGGAGGSAAPNQDLMGSLFQGMTGMAPRQQPREQQQQQQRRPQQQQPQQQQRQPQSGPSSSSSPAITSDMFAAAMAQAMAATVGSGAAASGTPAASSSSGATPMETSSQSGPATAAGEKSLEESLKTMREMGIADETLAKKALKLMGGDLQAAVDLVLSGWLGEDESLN